MYSSTEAEIVRPTKTVLMADHGDGSINTQPTFAAHLAGDPNLNMHTPCFDGVYRWWQEAPTPVHLGGQN